MRKNTIGHQVVDLLDQGRYIEAFDLFKQECEPSVLCKHEQNNHEDTIETCAHMCLLPKLVYFSLGSDDRELEMRVKLLREKLSGPYEDVS
jgi:hypothetical protein